MECNFYKAIMENYIKLIYSTFESVSIKLDVYQWTALVLLIIGLFLILSMVWEDYKMAKKDKENPENMYYRNGAGGGIVIIIGVAFIIISLIITLVKLYT